MSLYKTQPINRDDDMNPFIETEIVTKEILVGQPIPYRIQNILDKSKKNMLNTYNYYCDKCKIKYVEKNLIDEMNFTISPLLPGSKDPAQNLTIARDFLRKKYPNFRFVNQVIKDNYVFCRLLRTRTQL